MSRLPGAPPQPDAAARPRVLLCVNPRSGRGRGAGTGSEVAARLRSGGAEVEVLAVTGAGAGSAGQRYAGALAERLSVLGHAAGRRPDAVVVVGGDGMVHVTANVLAGTGIPLGLVPAGTGNDAARALGWADDGAPAAVERLLRSLVRPPRHIDLARVVLAPLPGAVPAGPEFEGTVDDRTATGQTPRTVTRYVVSGVDVAFDAAVTATANTLAWPRGRSRYVAAVLVELLRYRPVGLRIEIDAPDGAGDGVDASRVDAGRPVPTGPADPVLSGPVFLFAVMNGRFFGGGMEVTPGARIDDGVLEAFHVRPMAAVRFLRLFPRVFTGAHTDLPEVDIRPARSVRIEQLPAGAGDAGGAGGRTGRAPVLHGDGEPLGLLPATVTVAPGVLAVLDPDGGDRPVPGR